VCGFQRNVYMHMVPTIFAIAPVLRHEFLPQRKRSASGRNVLYCIELATSEKMLFDLPPISLTVPITTTRITANITAYSATS
jgi:hypothetical protein